MARSTAELRLPTVLTEVEMRFRAGAPVRGQMFLPDLPRTHASQWADDLGAMLNNEPRFVPVRVDGQVQLVHKAELVMVQLSAAAAPADAQPDEPMTLYDNMHRVMIELLGVGQVTGTVLYTSPFDRTRLIDHLNSAGRFFRLWNSESFSWLNKDHVTRVIPYE